MNTQTLNPRNLDRRISWIVSATLSGKPGDEYHIFVEDSEQARATAWNIGRRFYGIARLEIVAPGEPTISECIERNRERNQLTHNNH